MLRALYLAVILCAAGSRADALAQDRLAFGLDWQAEAEYGGYYQAVATGIYARHGLDVTIRQGGPQVNQMQLLLAGRLDVAIASNGYLSLNMAQENLPVTAIAAMFQRDPAVLLAHPGQGNDSFEQLRGKPVMLGADSRAGWWNFLRVRFGYTDAQVRPYTFNLAPFLADKRAVQQGYVTSEPFAIKQAAGFDPVVMMLADAGFNGYGSLIVAGRPALTTRADVLQRFIDASVEGWYSYLYSDPAPANALMRRDNPEMTDALLAFGRQALKDRGIVDSGDTLTRGIGAMDPDRWQAFLAQMAQQGLYAPTLDVTRAYTLQFVNKGTGLSMRPK